MSKTKKKSAKKQDSPSAKASWSETIKKALKEKRAPGGFPDQPKPRDSGVQKVRKNSF